MEDIKFICGVGIEGIEGIECVDVVDLESAKYLKSQGFNKPTHWYWLDKELSFVEAGLKRVKYGKRLLINHQFCSKR